MAIDAYEPAGRPPPAEPGASPPPPPYWHARYPVTVEYDEARRPSRLWAIPVLGLAVKLIILIPHYICLAFLGWIAGIAVVGLAGAVWSTIVNVVGGTSAATPLGGLTPGEVTIVAVVSFVVGMVLLGMSQAILWIWVLAGGRYPNWGYALVGGYLRWYGRYTAFLLGLTDQYPPFTLRSASAHAPYEVQVRFRLQEHSARFWAVPILGYAVKAIILIPHLIVLSVLGSVVALLQLILWAPVLFAARYPRWAYAFVGGFVRWTTRVYAYFFGLTDRYPPFSLA